MRQNMRQFRPIYCHFTDGDNMSIQTYEGKVIEECESWQGLHVDITQTDGGRLWYVIKLDRDSESPIESSNTLAVYDDDEIVQAWSDISARIKEGAPFSVPVYDESKRQAAMVLHSLDIVKDCVCVCYSAFNECEHSLESLQDYFSEKKQSDLLLQKLTENLIQATGRVTDFFYQEDYLHDAARELVESIKVTVEELKSTVKPFKGSQSGEDPDKVAQKHGETFDDYIENGYDLPF